MIRLQLGSPRWLVSAAAACVMAVLGSPAAGQDPEGWIEVLQPVEWSGDTTRGIAVVRRNSIRIEGLAYQPSGIDRVLIDGRSAQFERQGSGAVRFVGYADTDSVARTIEITAIALGADPPVSRSFTYEPAPEGSPPEDSEEAWRESVGTFSGERYAVVIGISEYDDDGIGSLRYADDDARAFYDFLVSDAAGLGGFEPDNVQLLTNEEADTRSVRTALSSFLRRATERDVVVIYLAGHGAPDPFRTNDYYFLTHDTEANNFPGTAVSMDDINAYIRQLRARDVIFFTDACHSGAITAGANALRAGPTNLINSVFHERLSTTGASLFTFTASETNQYSQEGTQWGGGHGVFTYELLNGLRGAADSDTDGIVDLGELVEYTRFAVQRETEGAQVPFLGAGSYDRSWPIAIADPEVIPQPVGEGGSVERVASVVDLVSPGFTFAHSLIIPGSGQLRTGRSIRGTLVLAGAAAAVTYGFLSTTTTQRCLQALDNGACPSGQFTDVRTERPHLVASIGAAAALTAIGAVDALLGARAVNRERLEEAGLQDPGISVAVLPTAPVRMSRPNDVRLLEFRFR